MTSIATYLGRVAFDSAAAPKFALPLPDTLTGVEVEVDRDGTKETVMPKAVGPEWQEKRDGSLNNGREYVLSGPLSGQALVSAVYKLYSNGTTVHRTYTGSTHIHLNMLDGFSAEALQALALITYAFESVLYYVGDNSRQWCGYANRMTSAPHDVLESLLSEKFQFSRVRNAVSESRYYGLNLQALNKYGTVEFRYFPTAESPEELLRWISLVQNLKKAAAELGSVGAVIEKLNNKEGYLDFVATYLSDFQEEVDAVSEYSRVKALMGKALIIASTWQPERAKQYDKKKLGTKLAKIIPSDDKSKSATPLKAPYFEVITDGSYHPSPQQVLTRAVEATGTTDVIAAMYYLDRLYIVVSSNYGGLDWSWYNEIGIGHPELVPSALALAEEVAKRLDADGKNYKATGLRDCAKVVLSSTMKTHRPKNTRQYVERVRPVYYEEVPPVDTPADPFEDDDYPETPDFDEDEDEEEL